MFKLTQSSEISAIQKGLNLLGLELSEFELNELQSGNYISLEGIGLSEIGSVFILAAALLAVNSGNTKKTIAFRDLSKAATESTCCSGIPIYCWNSDHLGKRCIYLTLVDGKPAVRTCCESDGGGYAKVAVLLGSMSGMQVLPESPKLLNYGR